ncbi:glucosidase family protein [Rhodococcus chondri]|uniref:Prenyltransferase n=1 Tax=Rhodococcus chondri TaxID=3065941 RepID=A0ABU7JQ32_9NOCA|nr:prenyltransferase [Rhodococcus sp. CC-R104]MEE2032132.1 prenyltransferase [Rhodococcus sp. CC-R104]
MIPSVPGILSEEQCFRTGVAIGRMQQASGAVPWFPGGHTDPWDHIESAMALTATGLREEADAAFEWSRRTQRPDGSWPIQFRGENIENEDTDSNFTAYIAVGVWHHHLVTGDLAFAVHMWPTVRAALDHVLSMQLPGGQIGWARGVGGAFEEALLTGCASIHQSLRCGIELANLVDDPQPDWEVALYRLGHALRRHPEVFTPKPEYSMDWYYPVLGGALRGPAAHQRIQDRWSDFVVDGLGIRCVDHRPWVTGAETCELVLALDALGNTSRARELFAAMQHLRDPDGSYWTGLVYADGKRWPVEVSSWTSATVVLAADALSRTTGGNGVFRDAAAPAHRLGAADRCTEHCPVLV